MPSLYSFLAAFVAILIAGTAVYQGRITQHVVMTSLEAIQGEIQALRSAYAPSLPIATHALAVPTGPEALAPPADPATEPVETVRTSALSDAPAVGWEASLRRMEALYEETRPRLSQGEIERVLERRRQRDAQRAERLLAGLESPDAALRARVAFGLDPGDRWGAEALAIALEDTDAGVRVEAASRLQFGEPHVALPLLVQALADPESEVVVEAIDSLKFLRDPAAIPDLEPLLEHPDPAVQREARAAVARLRAG